MLTTPAGNASKTTQLAIWSNGWPKPPPLPTFRKVAKTITSTASSAILLAKVLTLLQLTPNLTTADDARNHVSKARTAGEPAEEPRDNPHEDEKLARGEQRDGVARNSHGTQPSSAESLGPGLG